ncbi:hypothetical protein L596_024737 [Steinernema carpocapsae]|uniref:Uncharacterized protein n=1 Tax=Steinernema carpocapsae TaxID=34508 RepID=A0A4V5ZYK8_STECR|nr:hypothetical protein L596_024737 [Steinernema carpocapsae]
MDQPPRTMERYAEQLQKLKEYIAVEIDESDGKRFEFMPFAFGATSCDPHADRRPGTVDLIVFYFQVFDGVIWIRHYHGIDEFESASWGALRRSLDQVLRNRPLFVFGDHRDSMDRLLAKVYHGTPYLERRSIYSVAELKKAIQQTKPVHGWTINMNWEQVAEKARVIMNDFNRVVKHHLGASSHAEDVATCCTTVTSELLAYLNKFKACLQPAPNALNFYSAYVFQRLYGYRNCNSEEDNQRFADEVARFAALENHRQETPFKRVEPVIDPRTDPAWSYQMAFPARPFLVQLAQERPQPVHSEPRWNHNAREVKDAGHLIGPPVGMNKQPKPKDGCIYNRRLPPQQRDILLSCDRLKVKDN